MRQPRRGKPNETKPHEGGHAHQADGTPCGGTPTEVEIKDGPQRAESPDRERCEAKSQGQSQQAPKDGALELVRRGTLEEFRRHLINP